MYIIVYIGLVDEEKTSNYSRTTCSPVSVHVQVCTGLLSLVVVHMRQGLCSMLQWSVGTLNNTLDGM